MRWKTESGAHAVASQCRHCAGSALPFACHTGAVSVLLARGIASVLCKPHAAKSEGLQPYPLSMS